MENNFRIISPCNGFDLQDEDNAKQNNNAGPIAEMGNYIYVCTGRNIIYSLLRSGKLINIEPPAEFMPTSPDMTAEIWRYKKDASQGWERVFKAEKNSGLTCFDFMLTFRNMYGENALYAGGSGRKGKIIIFKTTNGIDWYALNADIPVGSNVTSVTAYKRKLYMAVADNMSSGFQTLIYSNPDPERKPWELITVPGIADRNPHGTAMVLKAFNYHLYAATALPGGFEVWRTRGETPRKDGWKLIVDRGAGDAANEIPMSMNVFKNRLYVGTGIQYGILSLDPKKQYLSPRGFDLIRIDSSDRWKLIVGGQPSKPTEPVGGRRGEPLSGYPSGFGNMSNAYCWQIQSHRGELYIGTWNWSILTPIIFKLIPNINLEDTNSIFSSTLNVLKDFPKEVSLLMKVFEKSFGFDLWKSSDGVNWTSVSLDGLGNTRNYGIRSLFEASDESLYLGTANPFEGCEIWVEERKKRR